MAATSAQPVVQLVEGGIIMKEFNQLSQSYLDKLANEEVFMSFLGPDTSPSLYWLSRFSSFFKSGLRVYMPAHLVILLLKLKSKKDSKGKLLKNYVIGVLRSALFISVMASSIPTTRITPMLNQMFTKKFGSWAGFIVSVIFCHGIFFESSNRWSDLSLYVLGQWFEGFTYSLVKRGYLKPIKNFENILMAISIGTLVYLCYANQEEENSETKKPNKLNQAMNIILGDLNFKGKS